MIKLYDGFRKISDVTRYNYNAMNNRVRQYKTNLPTLHSSSYGNKKPNIITKIVKFFKDLYFEN